MRWSGKLMPAVMLACLSTHAGAVTAAAPATCLTETEVHGLILYAMPDIAEQLGTSCAAAGLPASAYLVRSGADLLARYKAAAPTASVARVALAKMAGAPIDKFNALDDQGLHAIVGAGIASSMAKGIKPGDCRIVSDVLEQLAPLPPENIASLLGVVLREAGRKPDKHDAGPFRICGTEEGL